ncbi:protein PilG [Anaeromyxobacter sp. PSR-1]|nr:protein PilG [Anaeromyxobacter sp. PSR-1]
MDIPVVVARVLIVDDESDIRQAVAEVLAEEGHQVVAAGDGEEALAQIRAFHPQLVLLDLMMPVMNGWEFRAAQKGDPDISAIPVVILSAMGREGAIDADGYIQKPFDLEMLLSAVRRHAQSASPPAAQNA